jgi:hypothetical protein
MALVLPVPAPISSRRTGASPWRWRTQALTAVATA